MSVFVGSEITRVSPDHGEVGLFAAGGRSRRAPVRVAAKEFRALHRTGVEHAREARWVDPSGPQRGRTDRWSPVNSR